MDDAIPRCGWAKRGDNGLTPCRQPAVGVHQVWATAVDEFMADGELQPMALLVCRDHTPAHMT